jgi:hypothetical protein
MTAFWNIARCNFVSVYRRFRGLYYTHNQGGRSISEGSHLHIRRYENLKLLTAVPFSIILPSKRLPM